MNKNKKTTKKRSVKTERIFIKNTFESRSKKNHIKWNYQTAKKIHLDSIDKGIKPETSFKHYLEKKNNEKIKYIRRTYHFQPNEAKEILKERNKDGGTYRSIISKHTKINDITFGQEPIVEFPEAPNNNFLDVCDLIAAPWVTENAIVEFNLWDEIIMTNKKDFNETVKQGLRKRLDELDNISGKVYGVLIEMFNIKQKKQADFKTVKIIIECNYPSIEATLEDNDNTSKR